MVYYKVVLDDRKPTKDNYYPVVVRITSNRKTTTCTTGVRITKDHWKEESYQVKPENPNHQALNKKILEFYLKVQKVCLELEGENSFTFETLRERLNGATTKVLINGLFKPFSDQLISDMISINKTGNAVIYQTTINRFIGYVGNPKLKFTDINYTLLDGFNLDITIKTERTAKRAITIDTLIKIAHHELKPKSKHWHARNYFLLSFALIGASFTDLAYLTPYNIKKGRLIYRRRKTGKELSIKLQPFTERLLAFYDG